MKSMQLRQFLLFFAIAFLAACGTTDVKDEHAAVVEDRTITTLDDEDEAAARARAAEEARLTRQALDDPTSPLSQRSIYFDFDTSEIRSEYRPVIEAHAAYLADHPDTAITLEGNTDERGSREYNLALGERRAESVKRQMVLLGASAGQIRVVSYGEERPIAEGHNEEAWRLNRRVDIVY